MKLCAMQPSLDLRAESSHKQLAVPTQPPEQQHMQRSTKQRFRPCARRVLNSITLRGVWVFRPVTRVALVAIKLRKSEYPQQVGLVRIAPTRSHLMRTICTCGYATVLGQSVYVAPFDRCADTLESPCPIRKTPDILGTEMRIHRNGQLGTGRHPME